MSNCTRIPIFGRVNLHFMRNEIKCPIVQETQFLVLSIYILGEMKSNVQMYKNPNFCFSQFSIFGIIIMNRIGWQKVSRLWSSYLIITEALECLKWIDKLTYVNLGNIRRVYSNDLSNLWLQKYSLFRLQKSV